MAQQTCGLGAAKNSRLLRNCRRFGLHQVSCVGARLATPRSRSSSATIADETSAPSRIGHRPPRNPSRRSPARCRCCRARGQWQRRPRRERRRCRGRRRCCAGSEPSSGGVVMKAAPLPVSAPASDEQRRRRGRQQQADASRPSWRCRPAAGAAARPDRQSSRRAVARAGRRHRRRRRTGRCCAGRLRPLRQVGDHQAPMCPKQQGDGQRREPRAAVSEAAARRAS